MKIFVQHSKTKLYIGAGSAWVDDIRKAVSFKKIMPALDWCGSRKKFDIFLVLFFKFDPQPWRVNPFKEEKLIQKLMASALAEEPRGKSKAALKKLLPGKNGVAKMLGLSPKSKFQTAKLIPVISSRLSPGRRTSCPAK
jgi:hypothetical protein